MTTRRAVSASILSAGLTALLPVRGFARPHDAPGRERAAGGSYAAFLNSVRAQAIANGVPAAIATEALALAAQPNAKVLELDRHQPEFTLSWSQYQARVITPTRLQNAATNYQANLSVLRQVWQRTGVDPRVIVGIWGLESNFGQRIGSFNVIDALATLAYDGRRAAFFRSELLNALRILGRGGIAPNGMLGSYAGAMGQPQFMPSSYLRYAVSFDGDGAANIWTNRSDVFASVGNYLARCGWRRGEPWGQRVTLTRPIDPSEAGRDRPRPLPDWTAAGVRRADGTPFGNAPVSGALLLPDGAGGEAFMVYPNFNVIRRYNPSDFYALAVGLIGDAAT